MNPRSGRAALAVALLLLGGQPTLSQPKPPAPPAGPAEGAIFGEKIDVRAIDVEVVVADAAGKRVRGLKAADFRLLVDGKEERLDSFAEVVEGQSAPAAAKPASAAETPETAADAEKRIKVSKQQ